MALAQTRAVAALLGDEVEVVPVITTGDRDRARSDKEKWVKELEVALAGDEIDLAVHSAKDVPSVLPDGLELVGALPRANPHDALCGAGALRDLPRGARVHEALGPHRVGQRGEEERSLAVQRADEHRDRERDGTSLDDEQRPGDHHEDGHRVGVAPLSQARDEQRRREREHERESD